MLEGKSYRLKFPWVGVVYRSQADINKNVDMIAARRREREYFSSTPEYKHLAHRMGSEHLAKMLSKVSDELSVLSLLLHMCPSSMYFERLSTVIVITQLLMVNTAAFGSCNQVQNSRHSVPCQQNNC
jgi:hypothetical protein